MANHEQPISAIIILGAAVWSGGKPSPTLRRRTRHGIDKFHELSKTQPPPLMVLSGGLGKHPPSEADVMAQMCRDAGISGDYLVQEDRSTTTLENAVFSSKLIDQKSHLMIVSERYHLPRALMVFRHLGFSCVGSGPDRDPDLAWSKRIIMPLREALALPYYWVLLKTQKTQP